MKFEDIVFEKRNLRKDYSGQKFGRLKILWPVGRYAKKQETVYLCECDCGNFTFLISSNFSSGDSVSCGCHRREKLINRNFKHGKYDTVERVVWQAMKRRCYNKNTKDYYRYGGKGINVCDRWLDKERGFLNFLEDMGCRPSEKHSIDRINSLGNYEPSNCKWATPKEQVVHRSNSIYITFNGETKYLDDWCNILNINYKTMHDRLYRYKWPVEKAFTQPLRIRNI